MHQCVRRSLDAATPQHRSHCADPPHTIKHARKVSASSTHLWLGTAHRAHAIPEIRQDLFKACIATACWFTPNCLPILLIPCSAPLTSVQPPCFPHQGRHTNHVCIRVCCGSARAACVSHMCAKGRMGAWAPEPRPEGMFVPRPCGKPSTRTFPPLISSCSASLAQQRSATCRRSSGRDVVTWR